MSLSAHLNVNSQYCSLQEDSKSDLASFLFQKQDSSEVLATPCRHLIALPRKCKCFSLSEVYTIYDGETFYKGRGTTKIACKLLQLLQNSAMKLEGVLHVKGFLLARYHSAQIGGWTGAGFYFLVNNKVYLEP